MTALLEQAVAKMKQLSEAEKDAVAERLLQTIAEVRREHTEAPREPRPQFGSAKGLGYIDSRLRRASGRLQGIYVMRLLLDTHIFLWFIFGDPALSADARALIEDTRNVKLLSVVSVWEIAIKSSIGKLSLQQPFSQFVSEQVQRNGLILLPLELNSHCHCCRTAVPSSGSV